MCQHEDKYCPRCKQLFECKVGSILLCQCSSVFLNDEERDFIGKQYEDCLCASCLKALKAGYHQQHFQQQLKGTPGVFYKAPPFKT